jgi:hypothetical protein
MLSIKKSLDLFHVANAKDNILKTSSLQNFNEIESITLQFLNTRDINDDAFYMYNSALILLTETTPYFITNTKDKDGKILGTKVILRNQQKDYFLYRLKVEVLPRLALKVKSKISAKSLTFQINPLMFEEFNELYDLYANLPSLKISLNGTNFSMFY